METFDDNEKQKAVSNTCSNGIIQKTIMKSSWPHRSLEMR